MKSITLIFYAKNSFYYVFLNNFFLIYINTSIISKPSHLFLEKNNLKQNV